MRVDHFDHVVEKFGFNTRIRVDVNPLYVSRTDALEVQQLTCVRELVVRKVGAYYSICQPFKFSQPFTLFGMIPSKHKADEILQYIKDTEVFFL